MSIRNFLLIVCIGAVLFIPFLGHVHLFDWDEINFAESAREMLLTHTYSRVQINFETFYEKPPFFMWMQALSMSIFGVNEFAARFPNALTGIITLLVIFYIGSKKFDERFGWLWILCYIGSFLPHFYFKTGIIDPLFNLFIFLGIYQLSRLSNMVNYKESKKIQISILAGIFIGLGILTKGPVALLISMLTTFFYWATLRFKPFLKFKHLLIFLVAAFIVSCAWFGLDTINNGPAFILKFIQRQVALFSTPDAGHGGPFYYHFLVLLIGCFPASIFIFGSFRSEVSDTFEERNMKTWMIVLLFVVLILFSIVKTKIVHYSSLCYFPITFLAAYTLYKWIFIHKAQKRPGILAGILLIGVPIGILLAAIAYIGHHTILVAPYIQDKFGMAALHAKVYWSGFENLIGIFYLLCLLVSAWLIAKPKQQFEGFALLFVSTVVCIQLVLITLVGKIEPYSQGAAISFFESKQHENCYVEVDGYHSYAQYFYTQKQLPADTNMLKKEVLFSGPVDKPVYMVAKTQDSSGFMNAHHNFHSIGNENGFVFFKRDR